MKTPIDKLNPTSNFNDDLASEKTITTHRIVNLIITEVLKHLNICLYKIKVIKVIVNHQDCQKPKLICPIKKT